MYKLDYSSDNQINKQTKSFIYVSIMKTKKQLGSEIDQLKLRKLILTLLTATLSYFNFMLILKIWKDYNLNYIFAVPSEMINYSPKFADLIILCPIIGEYILISLTIIFTVSLFKKLKDYNEKALIWGLYIGLVRGMRDGLIRGLMCGLVVGFALGPIVGLVVGVIIGLLISMCGLISGIIFGLDMEFKIGILKDGN